MLEFSDLDKTKVMLMRRILRSLLLNQEDYVIQRVFSRIAPLPKLSMLRDGLKLFMQHFLLRPLKNKADNDPAEVTELENRIQIAERALNSTQAMMLWYCILLLCLSVIINTLHVMYMDVFI